MWPELRHDALLYILSDGFIKTPTKKTMLTTVEYLQGGVRAVADLS